MCNLTMNDLTKRMMEVMEKSTVTKPILRRSRRTWILHLNGRTYLSNDLRVIVGLLSMYYS